MTCLGCVMFFLFYKSYKNLKFYVLCYGYLFQCRISPKVKCLLKRLLEIVEKVFTALPPTCNSVLKTLDGGVASWTVRRNQWREWFWEYRFFPHLSPLDVTAQLIRVQAVWWLIYWYQRRQHKLISSAFGLHPGDLVDSWSYGVWPQQPPRWSQYLQKKTKLDVVVTSCSFSPF